MKTPEAMAIHLIRLDIQPQQFGMCLQNHRKRLISVFIFFSVKTNTWNQNTYTQLRCSPRRNWKWSWINSFLLLIQITTCWKCLQFDHEVGICHILDAAHLSGTGNIPWNNFLWKHMCVRYYCMPQRPWWKLPSVVGKEFNKDLESEAW